jgi:prepilin-type N-terminal cleavage/methylation domain-containing protein
MKKSSYRTKELFTSGFTLVELLVSMAILGVVLGFLTKFLVDSKRYTSLIINQSAIQEELRSAGSLIVDDIQRSIYVYPPCGIYSTKNGTNTIKSDCADSNFSTPTSNTDLANVNVSWSKLKLVSSGSRALKPVGTNDYEWAVGNDENAPILAMITVPRNPKKWCGDTDTRVKKTGCYQFVAYFPVKRSQVAQGTAVNTTVEKPGDLLEPDAANKDQWVIMEYRMNIDENLWYDTSIFKNLVIPGVGKMIDSVGTTGSEVYNLLDMSTLGKVTIPPMRWNDAGCDLIWDSESTSYGQQDSNRSNWTCDQIDHATVITNATKLPGINSDPSPLNQTSQSSIPALSRSTTDAIAYAVFNARMKAVTEWIRTLTTRGTSKVLVDNIQPKDGFQIEFPAAAIDERGVTEVRLKLQGGIVDGSSSTLKFPTNPIEFYATTRNSTP